VTDSAKIDCTTYEVTDSFFGAPYIDVDEWRDIPIRYRHVHGGFADCDTRFTFYFPEEDQYQGRLISRTIKPPARPRPPHLQSHQRSAR
jgi:hypothetical protein